MMKIKYEKILLVTGGAGFIGSAFLRKFVPIQTDWFFINLDLLTYAGSLNNLLDVSQLPNYKFIKGDICDADIVNQIFRLYEVNEVINFAAETHVDNSIIRPNLFMATNIMGTYNLMDLSKQYWKKRNQLKTSKFIQISTDEVYGSLFLDDQPSLEEDSILPNSPYSASKAAAELICRSYHKTFDFPVIVTRSSNNYGPFQNQEKLIPKVINNAIKNIKIPIYGNGNNIRDWVYVEDNCDAIMRILMNGRVGEIYNIGGGTELTNNQIIDYILEQCNKPLELKSYINDRLGHDFRYSLNCQKIGNLGWQPSTRIEIGIKKTIEFYNQKYLKSKII